MTVACLLRLPLSVTPRPNVVGQAVALYGRWRTEVEADHRADGESLQALLARGSR